MINDRVSLRRKPFLIPIWLLGIAGAVAFAVALFLVWVWATADSTTVIVALAPDASASGAARAAALSKMLGGEPVAGRVDAVYISSTPRNPAVSAPWSAHLSRLPTVFAGEEAKLLAKRALREHSGGRVLIVADIAMAQQVVALLSNRRGVMSSDWDADALYIITVPRIGHANLLRLNY